MIRQLWRGARAETAPPALDGLAFLHASRGPEAEAIRSLRTRVMAQHVERGQKMLVVCAATPNVGCSFVAANLAIACAQIGVKTVIVDADLRAPTLADLFGLPPEQPGLADHLANPMRTTAERIEHEVLPLLTAITAGREMDNPQELLAGKRFARCVTQLANTFDLAIFDTTPTNTCTDAQRVATVVGSALIVARKHHSFVGDVSTLSRLLRADRADVLGTVLTVF